MPPELAAARDEEKHEDFRALQRQNGWRKTKGFMMARVFVTGSADGLGKMAADLLIKQGHQVVLHARSAARADETRKKVVGAEDVVVGDLSSIPETKSVADQVNRLGRFDAVIHNAGIGYRESKLEKTADGLPQLFAVNTLGPYLLTALITMPKRLVYLSSGMHYGAGSHLDDMLWERRRWNGSQAYAETKAASSIAARTSVGSPSERTSRPLP